MKSLFVLMAIIELVFLIFVAPYQLYKKNKKKLASIVAIVLTAICFTLLSFNATTTVITFAILDGFTFLFEIVFWLFKSKKVRSPELISLGLSVVIALSYLGYCFYVANDLKVTNYSFDVGANLRIVQISDLHLGSYFSQNALEEIVNEANSQNPDVIVITGDTFDEQTSRKDLERGCEGLSKLSAPLGVYLIVGNHEGKCETDNDEYTLDEMFDEISKTGIVALVDEAVTINDDFIIVGRNDFTYDRKNVSEILKDSSIENIEDYKVIVLEHQPVNFDDFMEDTNGSVSLMLCGHTHGGQMFPITLLTRFILTHTDELTYGTVSKGDTNIVVTSGATGGMIPFKSMTVSEIVVIDLK